MFWDWKNCRILKRIRAHKEAVVAHEWLPHETSKVVTGSWDGLIKLWVSNFTLTWEDRFANASGSISGMIRSSNSDILYADSLLQMPTVQCARIELSSCASGHSVQMDPDLFHLAVKEERDQLKVRDEDARMYSPLSRRP